MSDRPSLIQQVSAITGCNDFQAGLVLERCNWDMERAVNSFFDDPPPENPVPSSTAQSPTTTAIVPFQGGADRESAVSGWDVPNNPAYAPPPGQPPASAHNWGQHNKDIIDLTNDTDADDDLRRAMAASLQDHQSQQAYRPPAPSSTVGVSLPTAAPRWNSTDHVGKVPIACQQIDDDGVYDTLPPFPTETELGSIFEAELRTNGKPQEDAVQCHGYKLRDRSALVRPNNTVKSLFEMGQCAKSVRTYADRTPRRNRRQGRIGRARMDRGAKRRRSWSLDIGMSEDEQLRQALEASVQSHHDLLQSSGSGARTPAFPQHLETDLHSRRVPGAPVAMVAPFASLEVVAALLQALFAAPPVRRAYLAARPVDQRGSDLSNYWKGVPPTQNSGAAAQPALETHFELAQRIQTLFAFAHLSQRPLCVVKDVTALTPSEVVARGADNSPPIKVASLFYEYVVDSFTKHVAAVSDSIVKSPSAEPAETDALWMSDALFLSSGAAALTTPASPRSGNSQGESAANFVAPPNVEQQRSFIQLRHDSVHSDTYSCLRAALASDGEGALLTRTAHTISMAVDHALPTAEGGPPPFTINERIHLDSLMWDRRQGVRLDAELRDLEMVRLDAMRQDLENRKRKLIGDGGRPMNEVLSGAKRYFDEVASAQDGVDAVRSSSIAEAAPQIDRILGAVQADLVATEQLIGRIRAQIDAKRARVAERARLEAANPEWTQLAYDLCAVLCHEVGQCVSLVKQADGMWWKIRDGRAVRVEREDVVMGRAQDASPSVFWLVYARTEDGWLNVNGTATTTEEDLVGETVKAAIADDNLTYESELLSLIRSDAVTPSSTVEDMDVSDGQVEAQVNDTGVADAESADITITEHPRKDTTSVETPKCPRTG